MAWHLFGCCCTAPGIAANNRGERAGTIAALQKILWQGEVHTTVSAEAIRWGLRYFWQQGGWPVNRQWDEAAGRHHWADPTFAAWADPAAPVPIDDDVLGFMTAQAAAAEANPAEAPADDPAPRRGRRARGRADRRRGVLEVTRAVSLTPYAGDLAFNVAGPGAAAGASRTGHDPVPYGTELHATRYQWGFACTPEALRDPRHLDGVIDGIVGLSRVAGNHARFLFDFAPAAVVFRWTVDPAPRILYVFAPGPGDTVTLAPLIERVQTGDLDPRELLIGGQLTADPAVQALGAAGAALFPGVRAAAAALKQRIARDWPAFRAP